MLFKTFFDAGFVMDALDEPVAEMPSDSDRALSWSRFPEIPSVLAARMILASP